MASKQPAYSKGIGVDQLTMIKRRVVIALVRDDELMQRLVLKGGNALELVHHATTRASFDLDFSMESDFPANALDGIRDGIEGRLRKEFAPVMLHPFDVTLIERPEIVSDDIKGFWGGYLLNFKLSDAAKADPNTTSLDLIRKQAVPVGRRGSPVFQVDISKFEYCEGKQAADFDGYTAYAYSPEMIVCEKLRAICQQTDEYQRIVRKRHAAQRARDFIDIYFTIRKFSIDLTTPENLQILGNIFNAKRVPLRLLDVIPSRREFHHESWPAVKDTVRPGIPLETFDFYFDYVINLTRKLKALRDE